MGLRGRLLGMLLVPLVVAVGAHGLVRVRQEERRLLDERRRQVAAVAAGVQIALEGALRRGDQADVHRLLFQMTVEHEAIDQIRLFSRGRVPVMASARRQLGGVPADAVAEVMRTGRPVSLAGEAEGVPVFYRVMPIEGPAGSITGAAEVAAVADDVREMTRRATRDVWVRLALVIAVVAGVTVAVVQREVFRPLAALLDGIRRLARGEAEPRLPVQRADELGRVAQAFNHMAAQLAQARRRLVAETERALDLERELRRAQTLAVAGKLVSAVAHEIGTPLTIVSGRAEVVRGALPADHPHRPDLDGIVEQIDRISGLITTVLDVVRPQKPARDVIHLRRLLDSLWPLMEYPARRHRVVLTAEVDDNLPPVSADAGQIQQVLINVVMNAIEATPGGGRVTLQARAAGREGRPGLEIAVQDTGHGMPPDVRARVFEPFFTTKPPGRGTGLGLAISRDIVREHGGHILLESAPGAGTTVVLWLPAEESPA
ncbi:MAG TPA: ATP-binding protein [Candidatus Binatia bacterium]|nr:ATP-binding protein [Candidatus Binatia bacterium]